MHGDMTGYHITALCRSFERHRSQAHSSAVREPCLLRVLARRVGARDRASVHNGGTRFCAPDSVSLQCCVACARTLTQRVVRAAATAPNGPATASCVRWRLLAVVPRTCLHATSASACTFALALAALGCSWRDSAKASHRRHRALTAALGTRRCSGRRRARSARASAPQG
jgi:hypothetical protein